MLLRSLYLCLGVLIGAFAIALHEPSLALVQQIVGKHSKQETKVAALDAPTLMQDGFDKPRRVFVDEDMLSVPLNWSWNYLPDDPVHGIGNWVYYGGVGDDAEQFTLGWQFAGKVPLRFGGVRSEVSGLSIFREKKIKLHFFGTNRKVETRFGAMTLATFTYKHNGIAKACIAYLSDSAVKQQKIEGFVCGAKGEVPKDRRLSCLVNSIRVYDNAYWQEPKSGRKGSKPACFSPTPEKDGKSQSDGATI